MNNDNFEAELLASSGVGTVSTDGSKKLMVDLLHDTFGADDLVKIKNFTNKKTGWVYSDRRLLRVEQPNEFTRRVWQGEQKHRILNPGQTVIVPGWEAYIGLVRFFKQYVAEEYSGKMGVMMNSPQAQMDFISKAFVGIYDPNEAEVENDTKAEVEKDIKKVDAKKEVEDDLGLVNEKPKAK